MTTISKEQKQILEVLEEAGRSVNPRYVGTRCGKTFNAHVWAKKKLVRLKNRGMVEDLDDRWRIVKGKNYRDPSGRFRIAKIEEFLD